MGCVKMGGVLPPDHKGPIEVIDQTAYIENLMTQVIEGFCKPAQKRSWFFRSVLLNSSIMPLGGKVRAAPAIAQHLKFKVDASQLYNVLSLRNAFAHHKTSSHPLLVVGKTPEVGSAHYQLQIISSSGRVTGKKREEALAEFRAAYKVANANMEEFIRIVEEHNKRHAA